MPTDSIVHDQSCLAWLTSNLPRPSRFTNRNYRSARSVVHPHEPLQVDDELVRSVISRKSCLTNPFVSRRRRSERIGYFPRKEPRARERSKSMVSIEARDNGGKKMEGGRGRERERERGAVKAKLWVFTRFARLRP